MAVSRWTPEALRDLEDVYRFLSRSSAMAANATVDRMFDAADRLAQFPGLGTAVPELSRSGYRQVTACSTGSMATRSSSVASFLLAAVCGRAT